MDGIFELGGQRALVTGGTKGIGQAVAAGLREADAGFRRAGSKRKLR